MPAEVGGRAGGLCRGGVADGLLCADLPSKTNGDTLTTGRPGRGGRVAMRHTNRGAKLVERGAPFWQVCPLDTYTHRHTYNNARTRSVGDCSMLVCSLRAPARSYRLILHHAPALDVSTAAGPVLSRATLSVLGLCLRLEQHLFPLREARREHARTVGRQGGLRVAGNYGSDACDGHAPWTRCPKSVWQRCDPCCW